MTNEKKVIELIGCEGRRNCLECGGSLSVENGCSMFRKMMAMAQWKDQEFAKQKQALIDKACDLFCKAHYHGKSTCPMVIESCERFNKFRTAMEETK